MDDNNRGPELVGVLVTFQILATISTAARFYTRGFILRSFFFEDWLAAATWVLFCVYTATGCLTVQYGTGQHTDNVDPALRPVAIMWRWVASTIYIAISWLTKLIVAFFLLRACSPLRWQRVLLWCIIVGMSVYSIFYLVLAINACQPIRYEWDRYNADPVIASSGTCNAKILGEVPTYVAAFLNVLVDWMLAIIPATILWKTKLNGQIKLATWSVLAVGSIASIATIARLPFAKEILNQPDYLYNFTDLGIWSTIEIGIALTASSLATLKPLFRKWNAFDIPEIEYSGDSKYDEEETRSNRNSALAIQGLNELAQKITSDTDIASRESFEESFREPNRQSIKELPAEPVTSRVAGGKIINMKQFLEQEKF